jgi:3-methylcrotonyl-CoA carboxylase alpha subunit
MAKVLLKQAGQEIPLEVLVERLGGSKHNAYRFCIGEKKGEIEIGCAGQGEGWVRLDTTAHGSPAHGTFVPYHVVRQDGRIQVWVAGKTYSFEVVDGAARRTEARGPRADRRSDRLTAPMPGTVLKIAIQAGESFEAHQPLVIMESMKMELTLSVPHLGRVADITCREGQLVEMGAVLVRLEPNQE